MKHTLTSSILVGCFSAFLLCFTACDSFSGETSAREEDSLKIVSANAVSALRCPDMFDVKVKGQGKPEERAKFLERLMGLYNKWGLDKEETGSRALEPGGIPEQLYYAIQFHVLSPNGQSSATQDKIVAAVKHLNEVFGKVYINFKVVGISNVTTHYNLENFYYELGNGYIEDIFDANNKKNVINIYLVDNSSDGGMLNGFTYPVDFEYSPNGRNRDLMCLASRTVDNGKTLAHEMGHFFTLMHTFNSVSTGGGMITDEKADGSNCATSGDLICDTPADPFDAGNIDVRSCSYTGDKKDPYGNRYKPMINNFMAYYDACCEYKFTSGQYRIIRTIAEKHRPYLKKKLPSTTISTPATTATTTVTTPTKPVSVPPASVTVKPTTTTTTTTPKPTTTTTPSKPATTTTKPTTSVKPATTPSKPTTTTTKPTTTTTTKPGTTSTPPKPAPMKPKDSSIR